MITHIVAKTLVFDDRGKLLVLTRSDDDEHRAGGLDLPGGQVDDGETVTDGAVREAFEETGLKLNPDAMRICFAYTRAGYRESLGEGVSIVWLGYVTTMPREQEIVLSHEHSAFEWLTLDQFMEATDHRGHHDLLAYIKGNRIASELWDKAA